MCWSVFSLLRNMSVCCFGLRFIFTKTCWCAFFFSKMCWCVVFLRNVLVWNLSSPSWCVVCALYSPRRVDVLFFFKICWCVLFLRNVLVCNFFSPRCVICALYSPRRVGMRFLFCWCALVYAFPLDVLFCTFTSQKCVDVDLVFCKMRCSAVSLSHGVLVCPLLSIRLVLLVCAFFSLRCISLRFLCSKILRYLFEMWLWQAVFFASLGVVRSQRFVSFPKVWDTLRLTCFLFHLFLSSHTCFFLLTFSHVSSSHISLVSSSHILSNCCWKLFQLVLSHHFKWFFVQSL